MKIDKLFDVQFNRAVGGSHVGRLNRDRINGLLLVGLESLAYRDLLHVKLRHSSGVTTLVDRMPLPVLNEISGFNFGYSLTGANLNIAQEMDNHLDSDPNTVSGIHPSYSTAHKLTAIYVDLGHITLSDSELEIETSFEGYGGQSGLIIINEKLSVYGVHIKEMPDKLLKYNLSKDMYTNEKFVRDAYLWAGAGYSGQVATPDDGQFFARNLASGELAVTNKYDDVHATIVADDRSYGSDIKGYLAATALFSNTEILPASNLVRIYRAMDALPDDLHIKITGADSVSCALVFVTEFMLAAATSASTVANAQGLVRKIRKLEQAEPETAKAYRHAGVIPKADELQAVVNQTPSI